VSEHGRALLDTSVVIELPNIAVESLPAELAISVITLAELAAGPLASGDVIERAARQQHLQWVEATFDPLPFDADAARCYGQLYALVLAGGRRPRRRLADLLIASVAAAASLPLFTRNPGDFAGLEPMVEIVQV
jgi:predicted nucleic acid-binding protein